MKNHTLMTAGNETDKHIKYSVVLPCYNEAGNIMALVDRFRQFSDKWDFELVLVNNGSTDKTADILNKITSSPSNYFIRVVNISENIGYGHGIHTGLKNANGDILAYSHADIQTPPEDIFRAFELIEKRNLDLSKVIIKGIRPGRESAQILTRGLSKLSANILGISHIEDINGQPKVFHKKLMNHMSNPVTDFSFDTYVIYIAVRDGYSLINMDVRFDQRLHGESKWATTISKKYKTIVKYLISILKISWYDRHLKTNPIGQILRFCVSGMITNFSNYLTFFFLLKYLNINYLYSSVTGFFAGFVVGFFLNKNYTFGLKEREIAWPMFLFLLVNIVSLIANTITIYSVVDIFNIRPELGQLVAILVSACVNFTGMKYFIFSRKIT